MPIQKRHGVRDFGAVSAGTNSIAITLEEATRGILFIAGTSGAVVTLQFSPDGGTTWHNVYLEGDVLWTATLGSTPEAHIIPAVGRMLRIAVATQALTGACFEGIREI